KVAVKRQACQDMIEHLRAAMVEDAPPPVRRKGAIEQDERARGQRAVAGILLRTDGDAQRVVMVLRVEVAGDRDEAVWVGREQLRQQQTQLERLPGAPHGGE